MEYAESIVSTAPRDTCWSALSEVATWPQWTASMTEVAGLDGPNLKPGNRFRVTQPGLPKAVWEVTEVKEGESFVWVNRAPGVHTVAFHRLTARPDGTEIAIGITQTGPLAWLVGALTAGKTRRYLKLEAAGLKAASESHGV